MTAELPLTIPFFGTCIAHVEGGLDSRLMEGSQRNVLVKNRWHTEAEPSCMSLSHTHEFGPPEGVAHLLGGVEGAAELWQLSWSWSGLTLQLDLPHHTTPHHYLNSLLEHDIGKGSRCGVCMAECELMPATCNCIIKTKG